MGSAIIEGVLSGLNNYYKSQWMEHNLEEAMKENTEYLLCEFQHMLGQAVDAVRRPDGSRHSQQLQQRSRCSLHLF